LIVSIDTNGQDMFRIAHRVEPAYRSQSLYGSVYHTAMAVDAVVLGMSGEGIYYPIGTFLIRPLAVRAGVHGNVAALDACHKSVVTSHGDKGLD